MSQNPNMTWNNVDTLTDKSQESVEVGCTFYGPNCRLYATQLRDGLWVGQNREALFLAGMGIEDISDVFSNNELVNNQWLQRADIKVHIAREIVRDYAILALQEAIGAVHAAMSLTRTVPLDSANHTNQE